MEMLYLAIDQHSKQLTVNLRNESGDVLVRKQVSTRDPGPREFFGKLSEQAGLEGYAAIVEVCGFNDWLLDLLPQVGCREIVLVHPGKPGKRKTDHRDANQLGELLWVNRRRLLSHERVQGLRRVNIPSVSEREARRLVSMRYRSGVEKTRTLNRLQTILRRHNLQHACPTKTIQSKRAQAWLETLSLPELDRFEMDQFLARRKLLEQQREAIDALIDQGFQASPEAQLLRSLPGAGPYTALGLAAYVGDIKRFPRPRSLANYWGLTPTCHNSGESGQRLGSISKQGAALPRFLLAQVVLNALKRDGGMRSWYLGLRRRRGSKIARVAVMRRLCTIVWHMLTHRELYRYGARPKELVP
jgi:transposase